MDIYNSDPLREQNDQVVYNAMVCFHEGKSISLAIRERLPDAVVDAAGAVVLFSPDLQVPNGGRLF